MRTLSISALAFAVAISVGGLLSPALADPSAHRGPQELPASDADVKAKADVTTATGDFGKPPGTYCTGPSGIHQIHRHRKGKVSFFTQVGG